MKLKFALLVLPVLLFSCSTQNQDKEEPTDFKSDALKDAKEILKSDQDFTMKVGEVAYYSGSVHGSVGSTFSVDYDAAFFKMIEEKFKYDDEERSDMPGGDAAVRTYYYKALKAGTFEFTVNNEFRGEIKSSHTIKITVTE